MHLSTSNVCSYLNASPSSECYVAGEAVLRAEHLLLCGITSKQSNKWTVRAYCVQTSGLKSEPHEITGVLMVGKNEVAIDSFTCSCKAGLSGTCKHVSATLQFCTRKPIEKIDELSCTQIECMWKKRKVQIEQKYDAKPLHESECFKTVKQKKVVNIPDTELFHQATLAAPDSEFTLQLKGRRRIVRLQQNPEFTVPDFVKIIVENAEHSSFLTCLDVDTNIGQLQECCQQVLSSLEVNIFEALCTEQGTAKWKMCRKNRVTGSTCYSVYTFSKTNWSSKLRNFFNPKNVKTKEMKYGSESEALAISTFEKNNLNYEIKRLGVFICKSFPWLAYSPDGVIFCSGKPQRLLEVKCPYLGKIKSGVEVLKTLPYLDQNFRLKEKHSYYAQVQFGMALLNLKYCDFIIFFTKDNSYLHISIPFDQTFANKLLNVCSQKYLNKMVHYICQM